MTPKPRRRAASRAPDVAVEHPACGRMRIVSRSLFADPSTEVCQRFVGRVFEVPEVRAVEILAAPATAQIEYVNGVVPSRTVVEKIARRLRNGGPAPTPHVDPLRELPVPTDGAAGWRIERHGPVLSTWEVVHELPGRIRFRNRLIRRRRPMWAAVARALGRVPGVRACRTNAHTATALVVFDPARLERPELLRRLDRALRDAVPLADASAPARPGDPGAPASYASHERRWDGREFTVSGLSLLVSAVGDAFYPPLSLAAVPGKLWVSRDRMINGVHDLTRRHTVSVDMLVTVLNVVSLLYGYIFLFCLTGFVQLCAKNLLDRVKRDSRADYTDIFRQQARTVWVRVGDVEIERPLETVAVGDVVAVIAGQTIPVDGRVVDGAATVDQHVMTGEAIPAEKGVGDRVLALTVVLSGKIYVRVEQAGAATAAAHIARVLDRTVDFKTGRQLRAERMADRLVVPALVSGLATWPVLGASAGAAVVESHPKYRTTLASALGLLNYLKIATRRGLLVKDGRTLELLNEVDTVVFDKTGTLTLSRPHVVRLWVRPPHTAARLLALAAAAEQHQSHPIASAILVAARAGGVAIPPMTEADYKVGYGLTVTVEGTTVRVGSMRFMEDEAIPVTPAMAEIQARCHRDGELLVLVAAGDEIAGAIELHTTVRPEARRIVQGLRRRGITSTSVISGDHEAPTRRLADALGIDHYFAETLPEDKAALIAGLQEAGKVVCYVGDGINDAIAMKKAHVSVSLRGASTVATDTAEVVLMDESLSQLCALLDLARECNRNMRLTIGVVLAPSLVSLAGVLFGGFGFVGARLLNYTSLAGGIAAAMLPAWRRRGAGHGVEPEPGGDPIVDVPIEEHVVA